MEKQYKIKIHCRECNFDTEPWNVEAKPDEDAEWWASAGLYLPCKNCGDSIFWKNDRGKDREIREKLESNRIEDQQKKNRWWWFK